MEYFFDIPVPKKIEFLKGGCLLLLTLYNFLGSPIKLNTKSMTCKEFIKNQFSNINFFLFNFFTLSIHSVNEKIADKIPLSLFIIFLTSKTLS